MNRLRELIDKVAESPDREAAIGHVYEHMASKIDLIRAYPKLFQAARTKLLELVVVEEWDGGRRYFEAFDINSIQFSLFTVRALTGLKSGFKSSGVGRGVGDAGSTWHIDSHPVV
jgi:hypothetical protein